MVLTCQQIHDWVNVTADAIDAEAAAAAAVSVCCRGFIEKLKVYKHVNQTWVKAAHKLK